MSEGPMRSDTGATFADVWPASPTSQQSQDKKEVRHSKSGTEGNGVRPNEPAQPTQHTATKRTIALRDHRINTETFEGKLLGHGPARYRFQPTESISYFARLLTAGGIVNLWGGGIEQAIAHSTTHVRVGDRVAFAAWSRILGLDACYGGRKSPNGL
jgi:hypothetical protein